MSSMVGIPRGDRAVSPRGSVRTSPRERSPLPSSERGGPDFGESRARSFTTVEKDIKGYLSRKNPRAVTTQRWIKQWYSVSGDTITFYNTKEEEENGKTPVGSLELEGAVVQKAKEERAFHLTTPKKDLTLHTSSESELALWLEGLSGIIGALKRRQAGQLEETRDRQRLVELESRFDEILVMDLSDTAETALIAFNECRGAKDSPSGLLSPRTLKDSSSMISPRAPDLQSSAILGLPASRSNPSITASLLGLPSSHSSSAINASLHPNAPGMINLPITPLSPRGHLQQSPIRPLAMSNPGFDDIEELSVIPVLNSPRGGPAPPPRLFVNFIFASNRAVSWFARLVKFDVQEVQLPHRRHYLAARGVEGPEWYSLPILEYVTSAGEGQLRPTTWTVSETHAILRYICHSHAQAALWYPRELSVRIRVDEYLDWHLAVFRRAMHGLWQLSLNAALRLTNRDTDQPMQKVRSLVASSLQTLDVRLSQHEFIATDEDPTIADLVAATEVNSLVIMGWDMALYGQITRWRETMQLLDHWAVTNRQFVEFVTWLRNNGALVTP